MIYATLMTVLTLVVSPGAYDETAQSAPTFFEHVVGTWHGEGQLFGAPAEFEMSWAWELDQKFVKLTYSIRGATTMDAIAHYQLRDIASLVGVWVDTRGELLELSATVTDAMLETIWQSPTEKGRTTYEFTGPDSLEVRDYVHDGNDWKPFGLVRYSRAPA